MSLIDKIMKEKGLQEETVYPVEEYDKNNNLMYHKNSIGDECWREYDKNNNLIHYKDSDGDEYWREYDKNNNLIHYKNSDGFEYWREYDKDNNWVRTLKLKDGTYFLDDKKLEGVL